MIISVGYERNLHETASPKLAAALKNLGVQAVVLWMSGTSINPNEGIWDFHSVNTCWLAFHDAGLKVILKRMWAPAHATVEEKITYQPYTDGAGSWKLDANGNAVVPGQASFNPDRACVKEPAHIKPDWCAAVTARLNDRYFSKGYCDHFITWNEPGDGNYWPPVESRPYDEAYDRVWSEVYRPSAIANFDPNDATKRVAPWIVGPDAAYDDDLRRLLEKDKNERTFDVVSFHGYSPDGTLDKAFEVLDTRRHIVDDYRDGREVWNTEMGDGGNGWIVDYIAQAQSHMPYLGLINIASANDLFTPQSMQNETYEPTEVGRKLKEHLA